MPCSLQVNSARSAEVSSRLPVVTQHPAGPRRTPLLREVALLVALFVAYRLGRMLIAGHDDLALANADEIWHVERWLRLPDEQVWQAWALQWPWMAAAANWYYVGVHFPLTLLFLAWGWWRRPPEDYRWARRLIIRLTGLAFVIHMLVPLAPPRMMDNLGFVDTMATIGPSAYASSAAATVANQFAAMPSLHVGWALLLAVVVISTTSSRWRWLSLVHPAATALVVVVTANHYWLDGVVSAVLLGAVLLLTPRVQYSHARIGVLSRFRVTRRLVPPPAMPKPRSAGEQSSGPSLSTR